MVDHWWLWLVAACAVAGTLGVLAASRRTTREEPVTVVRSAPPTLWTPYAHPMGPVSGWPHVVDRPEATPTGSPADRSDVTDPR
ncbi:MAG: hypothetical protein FWD18_09365 [Micrococcales bacterium]|nr:hypothetical protein [Micrococcales bacterium]